MQAPPVEVSPSRRADRRLGWPSIAERFAAGKALRRQVPRASHAEYSAAPDRPDPLDLIEAQSRARLPALVPIRHARMLASPFSFMRGAAAIMARDLAATPTTGIAVQTCGDAHVANFGVFASAEHQLVFGIADFDETLPGPWEWDLKRLAASAVLCCRFLGASRSVGEEAVRVAVSSYRAHMRRYAHMGYLDLWYERIDEPTLLAALPAKVRRRAERKLLAPAKRRTHLQVLSKLGEILDDRRRIVEARPLIVHESHTDAGLPVEQAVGLFLQRYGESLSSERRLLLSRYRVYDVARKVVGIGSVGLRCWVVFLEGSSADDPLLLQIKEAQPSALAPHLGAPRFDNEGRRVVSGQRLIQGAPDILLGWGELDGTQFYVRQLRDMKGSIPFDPEGWRTARVLAYAMVCGWALALAHAKSGDPALIAGYVGRGEALDDALVAFGERYADQSERDYEAMQLAGRTRRIQVANVS